MLKRKLIALSVVIVVVYTLGSNILVTAQNDCNIIVSKDGSGDHSSITEGINSLASGETLCVKSGIYNEQVVVNTNNILLKNYPGETPIIDGGYSEALFRQYKGQSTSRGDLPGPGYYIDENQTKYRNNPKYKDALVIWKATIPAQNFGQLVDIKADNVTMDGFTIRNASGDAVGIAGSNIIFQNNKVDFAYSSVLVIDDGNTNTGHNALVQNNWFSRGSVKYFDPKRPDANGYSASPAEGVTGSVKVKYYSDATFRNNILGYSHAEGFAAAKGSNNVLFDNNISYNGHHVMLYATKGSENVKFANNFTFHTGHPDMTVSKTGQVGAGLVFGIETRKSAGLNNGTNLIAYNNIVYNAQALFEVRNNANKDHGYDTQMDGSYIGYNTFIAGPKTEKVINIIDNKRKHAHTLNNVIENNVVLWSGTKLNASYQKNSKQTKPDWFRHNLWSEAPPPFMRGTGDIYGNKTIGWDNQIIANSDSIIPEGSGTWGPSWQDTLDVYEIRQQFELVPLSLATNSGIHEPGQVFNNVNIPLDVTNDINTSPRSIPSDLGALEDNSEPPTVTPMPTPEPPSTDVNQDDAIDYLDIQQVIMGIESGDLNYDLNLDGSVDVFDHARVLQTIQHNAIPSTTPTPTPLPPSPTALPNLESNILSNGSFDQFIDPWIFSLTGGKSSFNVEEEGAIFSYGQISIIKPGTYAQLYQNNIAIDAQQPYLLKITARSNKSAKVKIYLQDHKTGIKYGIDGDTINLDTQWQTFSLEFTSNNTQTVEDVRLRLVPMIVKSGTIYEFDDIYLGKYEL